MNRSNSFRHLGSSEVYVVLILLFGAVHASFGAVNSVGLWHFDEASGATAADSSGGGHPFTLSGGCSRVAGVAGNAVSFNGSTGSGVTGSWATGLPTGHADRSISLWFKTTSTADAAFVSWGTSASLGLSQLGVKAGNLSFLPGSTATARCQVPIADYDDGQWHHLAFTYRYDHATMEIYVDAVLKKSAVVKNTETPLTGVSPVYMGRSAIGGYFFNGSIDNLAIYDRVLSAAEVATLSGLSSYPVKLVTVTSPAYCSDVSGNTTVSIVAPGFTNATAKCWQANGAYGVDSTVASFSLTGPDGAGSFVFPAASYPRGPVIIRIEGTDGTTTDTCYLQVYNTVGTSWKEGIPATPPPAATGLTLVYQDDFVSLPSMSPSGIGKIYATSKPGGGNFGMIPFTDVASPANPFLQRGTYLRIRSDTTADSTGFISSLHSNGSGFSVKQPCYMECRFIAQNAPGTWPAFWTLTWNGSTMGTYPKDEQDIIEAYGGEGGGQPNSPRSYSVTSHEHGQSGLPAGTHISKSVDMSAVAGGSGWAYTSHTYGMLVGPNTTSYYLDDVLVGSKTTSPISLADHFWFMVNMAAGGYWPLDLSRYGGKADMYVDYVRVYAQPSLLPSPWLSQDIGSVGVNGSSVHSGGTFTMLGSGITTASTNDSCRYAYIAASGDCSITARVLSQQNTNTFAKAGVMIRESLTTPSCRKADMVVTPAGGLRFYYRATAGTTAASYAGTVASAPYWVRVTRVGNTFTAYSSPDNVTWTQVGLPVTIAMASTTYIGLVQCSMVNTTLGMATLDNVTAAP